MKLVVSNEIRDKYPELRIGAVVAKNIDNVNYADGLEDFCKKTFLGFAHKFEVAQELGELKNVVAWRDVYRSFGINPKKKKPTAESLLARSIRSGYVPHISPAVDAYLCAETISVLPIGGYDLTKISGDINLRFASADESFMGVGSDKEETTIAGEVIYSDNARVLTRCWNYKDCDYSKIDTDTTMVALFAEGPVKEITDDEIRATVESIAENLTKFCNAICEVKFLTKEANELVILA